VLNSGSGRDRDYNLVSVFLEIQILAFFKPIVLFYMKVATHINPASIYLPNHLWLNYIFKLKIFKRKYGFDWWKYSVFKIARERKNIITRNIFARKVNPW